MGLYGPLVLYQVVDDKKATAERELEQLKDFGRSLKMWPNLLSEVKFGSDYSGLRSTYVYSESAGNGAVYPEKTNNYKFELIKRFNKISKKRLAIVVNDYNKLISGDPFISAAICYLNAKHILQIMSLRAPKTAKLESQPISGKTVSSKVKVDDVYHLLVDNSNYCHDRSKSSLEKLIGEARIGYSEIKIDWNGDLSHNVSQIFYYWNIFANDEMERLEMERRRRDGTAREMIRI